MARRPLNTVYLKLVYMHLLWVCTLSMFTWLGDKKMNRTRVIFRRIIITIPGVASWGCRHPCLSILGRPCRLWPPLVLTAGGPWRRIFGAFCRYLLVKWKEALRRGTVHVEPPIADEILSRAKTTFRNVVFRKKLFLHMFKLLACCWKSVPLGQRKLYFVRVSCERCFFAKWYSGTEFN